MDHPILEQAKVAAQKLTSDQARHLLENYKPIHSMRDHVGWWSQAGETTFKRELGKVAGLIAK